MAFTAHDSVPDVVGLPEPDARAWAEAHGLLVRVLPPEGGIVTADLNLGRVNFVVENGQVVKATIF